MGTYFLLIIIFYIIYYIIIFIIIISIILFFTYFYILYGYIKHDSMRMLNYPNSVQILQSVSK